MNTHKAGNLNATSKSKLAKVCVHQRVVDSHFNGKGQPSGNLVCRECGAVIPDSMKAFG